MDLVLRAKRIYNLLYVPDTVNIRDHLAVITKKLLVATTCAIHIHALSNPTIKTGHVELKKYVKVVDEPFRQDVAARKAKYIPTCY